MKKLKKFGKSSFAVVLSLVLCAGMVVPAFAASFSELQDVINNQSSLVNQETNEVRIGYDNGNVTLHENVTHETGESKLTISGADTKITLDLNGNTIDGNGEVGVIWVKDSASLTLEDSSEGGNGKITGGNSGLGGGVFVSTGGSFTMNGGEISGNTADLGGGVFIDGGSEFTMNGGAISGNSTDEEGGGGGVYIADDGKFTMTGGKISGNTAGIDGGVEVLGTFIMKDGEISGNTSMSDSGGVGVAPDGTFVMTGGKISGNLAANGGGGLSNSGSATMEGGEITGNTAGWGGGVQNWGNTDAGASFVMTGGSIADNAANVYGGDDIYSWCEEGSKAYIKLPNAKDMNAGLEGGKPVTGWYFDGGAGWGNGDYAYYEYSTVDGYINGLVLKAAHDEYFQLVDSEGKVLTEVEKGSEIDLSTLNPGEKDGWTFIGWTVDGEPAGDTLTVTGPITLEAVWEENEPEQPEQPDEPTPPVTPPTTPDVPGIPEEPGVTEIEDEDVPLAGLPVELAAEEPLTRGQLMAILHWMDSEPAAQLATFMDVAADHDFALAIGWAQENGIAVGVSATEFAPDQVVTRGQLINFLNRYAKYVGSDLVLEVEGNANETLTWAMAEEIINDFFARLYA